MKQRILLADDHQMFREALRVLLERSRDFEVVGETGDGCQVLDIVGATQPDIVCLDIEMPGVNGIENTRRILASYPDIRVIALSTYSDRSYIKDMLNAGALAYVTKTEAGSELLRAIECVSRNRAYLCPDATDAIRVEISATGEAAASWPRKLAPRETQVLKLVALGLTSSQIAEQLDIALSTVEVHRRNIMRKLDVDSAIGMTRYAIRTGLVDAE